MDSTAKTSPIKPPLITPSASPPPKQSFSHPSRFLDSTPPWKRQRLLAFPRRTPQASSSSSPHPQTPVDVQKAREANTLRLLECWASLAERHSRPVDEDDIVNIRTGKITKDNGFISNSRKLKFGAIAAPAVEEITDNEGSEEEEEDEYGQDELDAFGEASVETDDLEKATSSEPEAGGQVVPPVIPFGPADAEDLRDFMEAERRRKELYGSEIDEEEDESLSQTSCDDRDSLAGILVEPETPLLEEATDSEGQEDEHEAIPEEQEASILSQNVQTSVASASDDELDNWDVDESCLIQPVLKTEAPDSDSDIEIIDGPNMVPWKSLQEMKANSEVKRKQAKWSHSSTKQLQTPPRSQSSSGQSMTPLRDYVVDLPTDASPPPPLPIIDSSQYHSSLSDPSRMQPTSTEPKSTFTHHRLPKGKNQNISIPHLDLARIPKAKRSSPLKMAVQWEPSPTPETSSSLPASNLKPFVLLTPRRTAGVNSSESPSKAQSGTELNEDRFSDAGSSSLPKVLRPGKTKAKSTAKALSQPKIKTSAGDVHPITTQRTGDTWAYTSDGVDDSDDAISSSRAQIRSHSKLRGDKGHVISLRAPSKSRSIGHRKNIQSVARASPLSFPDDDISASSSDVSTSRRKLPVVRKRKRVPSEPDDQHQKQKPTYVARSNIRDSQAKYQGAQPAHASSSSMLDNIEGNHPDPRYRRQSSSRRRESSPKARSSGLDSDRSSEDDDSDASKQKHRGHRSPSKVNSFQPAYHYPYPRLPYTAQPQHRQSSQMFAPVPDPRAQFIIAQAMQQLSALVSAPWEPPPDPYTPSRHHRDRGSKPTFSTPTHQHPYPYSYDPNLSHATLPPDSPQSSSSDEKLSGGRRKSLVGRSRSRGRRVSFKVDSDARVSDAMDVHSSPPSMRSNGRERRSKHNIDGHFEQSKSKERAKTPNSSALAGASSETERRGRTYSRGQTPGPPVESSNEANCVQPGTGSRRKLQSTSRGS
ncbi:hypothetical protein B0H34DRAFT_708140 [Crassisporium funariophilum]|nr:hypothetical protein B0H34DRAFT_708140 [Crassisporium funariophilum]